MWWEGARALYWDPQAERHDWKRCFAATSLASGNYSLWMLCTFTRTYEICSSLFLSCRSVTHVICTESEHWRRRRSVLRDYWTRHPGGCYRGNNPMWNCGWNRYYKYAPISLPSQILTITFFDFVCKFTCIDLVRCTVLATESHNPCLRII